MESITKNLSTYYVSSPFLSSYYVSGIVLGSLDVLIWFILARALREIILYMKKWKYKEDTEIDSKRWGWNSNWDPDFSIYAFNH